MSLAEALAAADFRPTYGGPKCGVCRVLLDLDDVDREALEKTFEGRVVNSDLSTFLRDNGIVLSQGQLARHRRKDCRRDAS
jgi:hypothetical protein